MAVRHFQSLARPWTFIRRAAPRGDEAPKAEAKLQLPRRLRLSVGRRIGLLTFLPLAGLAAIFLIFWTSAHEVETNLAAGREALQSSLKAKRFRDAVMTAQFAIGTFVDNPNAAKRASLIDARASLEIFTDALRAGDGDNSDSAQVKSQGASDLLKENRRLVDSLAQLALSRSVVDLLARQGTIGFDDDSGLRMRIVEREDALAEVVANHVSSDDPPGAATNVEFGKLKQARYKFALARDEAARDDFEKHVDAMRRDIDASTLAPENKHAALEAVAGYLDAFAAWAKETEALNAARKAIEMKFGSATALADSLVLSATKIADAAQASLSDAQARALRLVEISIGLAILLGGAASYWIGRSLSQSVRRLARTMGKMAQGDFEVTIDDADRSDEIGDMGRAVLTFREAGLERIRLQSEAEAASVAAEHTRGAHAAERAALAEADRRVVAALGGALRQLSDGDLVSRLEERFSENAEPLRGDFNAAVERLQAALLSVDQTAEALRARMREIFDAALDLSKRTERQAGDIEETAHALDQATAAVKQTAGSAHRAKAAALHVKTDAAGSDEVVARLVGAMAGIADSAGRIRNILSVIDDIAFQTNLLALNAGVEAARVGAEGKGFAVVAQEVRALAVRCAEAAREIKALVARSEEEVTKGGALAGEAKQALERIVEGTADLSDAISEIAVSAKDQAGRLDQINESVAKIDDVTRQNAAMVEETTAATQSLAQDSEELAGLVGRFKTRVSSASGKRALPLEIQRRRRRWPSIGIDRIPAAR
jgi:methyl-accepting chemotaxis protein